MNESALHSFTVDLLRATARPEVIWTHVPNEGKRDPRSGAILKRKGMLAGWPDFTFVMPEGFGRASVAFLELKRAKGGKLSEAQVIFKRRADSIRAPYVVARTPDEVSETLESWNVTKGRVN